MEAREKEKGDMFDIMVVDEAKIRLGEEGWKERYYQVTACTIPVHPSTAICTLSKFKFGSASLITMPSATALIDLVRFMHRVCTCVHKTAVLDADCISTHALSRRK